MFLESINETEMSRMSMSQIGLQVIIIINTVNKKYNASQNKYGLYLLIKKEQVIHFIPNIFLFTQCNATHILVLHRSQCISPDTDILKRFFNLKTIRYS